MAMNLMIAAMLLLNLSCVGYMIYKLTKQPAVLVSAMDYCKLTISGILAFISDAVGLGSFAINIALAELLGTFHDDELPAMNNGAQVIPGIVESLFFMQIIDVEMTTLVTLVAGACVGGVLGGSLITHLSKQSIRLAMMFCFTLIIGLLISEKLDLLPASGVLTALHSWKLLLGFAGMVICGILTSVGIGLFVLVQTLLFVLNVSPLVAFPIMTTAGAMQQPLTTFVFLQQDKIPLKKTLILSVAGCLGVLFVVLIFKHITITWLHTLLLFIVAFNLYKISSAYFRARRDKDLYASC